MTEEQPPPGVDISRPNVARMYDYMLGGTLNYAVDRDAVDRLKTLEPLLNEIAWANRGFLQRAVAWMARQGIDQFIDFGAGLPTMNNTHEVAHRINPDARVVYSDSDHEVCAHGIQLIGNVNDVYYITGDIHRPMDVLNDPLVARVIDFERPVGVLVVGLLYFLADPYPPVDELVNAVAPGSYIGLSHFTADNQSPERVAEGTKIYSKATAQPHPRSKAEVERLFYGLTMASPYEGAAPGLSYVGQWGADDSVAADDDAGRWFYAGVAGKP